MKVLTILLATVTVAWSVPKVYQGEIDGAKYIILTAEKPSGKVLLLAHGYRGKGQVLSANFNQNGVLEKSLLAKGWTIASTSYRRNGWIIDDALTDLRALQQKVISIQGKPTTTYLLGNSMGAQIAILAAEGALKIDGAITTGAALQNHPKREINSNITYIPSVPVILLINQESNRPMSVNYHKKAGDKNCALWMIERVGHCNVSDAEKLAAIQALQDWGTGKKVERQKDATISAPNLPSTAESALLGKATHISEAWGNITTSFVAADLKSLDIELKDELVITVGTKSQTLTLARYWTEVPKGNGVAYITAEGYLRVMMFGKSLASQLDAQKGSRISLSNAPNK